MADKDNYFFPDFEEQSEGASKKVKNRPRSTRIIWMIMIGLMVIICVVIFSMEDQNSEQRQVSSDTSPPAAVDIKPATGVFSDSEAIREIIYKNLREQILDEARASSEDQLAVPVAVTPVPKAENSPRIVRKPPSEQMENVRRMTEAAYAAPAAVELANVQTKKDDERTDTLRVPDESADTLAGLISAYLPQDQAAGAPPASQGATSAQTESSVVSRTNDADSNASSTAHQDRANAYAAANTNTGAAGGAEAEYLSSTRRAPLSRYELAAGAIISGVMIGGINSDLPGTIVGQVSEHVYDTATGAHILIPQGARMVGAYDSHVVYGQNRLLVVWNRIIYPDGTSLNLEGMLGSDQRGYAGFKQKTDNHYSRMLGAAVFASVFVAAGKEATKDDTSTASDSNGDTRSTESIFAETVMENVTNVASQALEKNMNIAPTLRILPGYRFSIITTRDVSFAEPYIVRGAPR